MYAFKRVLRQSDPDFVARSLKGSLHSLRKLLKVRSIRLETYEVDLPSKSRKDDRGSSLCH